MSVRSDYNMGKNAKNAKNLCPKQNRVILTPKLD